METLNYECLAGKRYRHEMSRYADLYSGQFPVRQSNHVWLVPETEFCISSTDGICPKAMVGLKDGKGTVPVTDGD